MNFVLGLALGIVVGYITPLLVRAWRLIRLDRRAARNIRRRGTVRRWPEP